MWLSRLAPKRKDRRLRWGEVALGLLVLGVVLAYLLDLPGRLAARQGAYAPLSEDADAAQRQVNTIRYRIGVLLKPRDSSHSIGGDPVARLREAGYLYGRLAVIEERRGNRAAAEQYMEQGKRLLSSAGSPDASEQHIRETVAKQDASSGEAKE